MSILKVEPDAINSNGEFALGGVTTTGNVSIGGKLIVNNTILPTTANTIDIGTPTMRFGALYLAGNTIDLGGTLITTTAGGDLSFSTSAGNIEITANTVSFLSTVANSVVSSGNVAFTADLTAEAVYSNSYFYANGTPYYNTGYTGSAGISGTNGYTGSRGADGTAGGGYLNLLIPGAITAPLAGTARFYPPASMIINTVYANLSANPTNGNLTFIIKKNGTSTGTTFSLSTALMNAVSVNIVLATTDYLTVDVTGSAMGSDLHIKLKYI